LVRRKNSPGEGTDVRHEPLDKRKGLHFLPKQAWKKRLGGNSRSICGTLKKQRRGGRHEGHEKGKGDTKSEVPSGGRRVMRFEGKTEGAGKKKRTSWACGWQGWPSKKKRGEEGLVGLYRTTLTFGR